MRIFKLSKDDQNTHTNTVETDQKTLVIVAGVNGAGKSTAYENSPEIASDLPIINPDVYAKEFAKQLGVKSINDLPANLQTKVNIKAGKLALEERELALNNKKSFGIETTASSESILKIIDKAHKLNYRVNLIYIMLPNEYTHIKRVMQRVKKGGHNIDKEDIKRRFHRAQVIFPKLLCKVDYACVYDNTLGYQVALEKESGTYKIFPCNKVIFQRLVEAVQEIYQSEKQTNPFRKTNKIADIEK